MYNASIWNEVYRNLGRGGPDLAEAPKPLPGLFEAPSEVPAAAAGAPAQAGLPRPRRLPLSSAHIGPHVEWAQRGTWAKLHIPSYRVGRPIHRRGIVQNYSAASRQRFLGETNKVDRSQVEPRHMRFVTLTYPSRFVTPRQAKVHVKSLLKRFQREFGRRAMFWKLEPQERGAPHFHLLVLMGPERSIETEIEWWARCWSEVVGAGDVKHLLWHRGELGHGNKPCVELVRDWHGVMAYAVKYLGKLVEGHGWERPGRWWGKINADLWPMDMCWMDLPERPAFKIRRQLVRWYEHQLSDRVVIRTGPDLTIDGKHVLRGLWRNISAELLEAIKDSDTTVVVHRLKRRWKGRARAGCTMFIPAEVVERVADWVVRSEKLQT